MPSNSRTQLCQVASCPAWPTFNGPQWHSSTASSTWLNGMHLRMLPRTSGACDDDGLRLKHSPLPSTASLKVTSTGPVSAWSSDTVCFIDTTLYVHVLSCPYSHDSSFTGRPFICS